jgi:hypothetical protein
VKAAIFTPVPYIGPAPRRDKTLKSIELFGAQVLPRMRDL